MEVGFLLPGSARRKNKNPRVVPIISQPAKTDYSTGTRTRASKKCQVLFKIFIFLKATKILSPNWPRRRTPAAPGLFGAIYITSADVGTALGRSAAYAGSVLYIPLGIPTAVSTKHKAPKSSPGHTHHFRSCGFRRLLIWFLDLPPAALGVAVADGER
jgi:hypothetical protein